MSTTKIKNEQALNGEEKPSMPNNDVPLPKPRLGIGKHRVIKTPEQRLKDREKAVKRQLVAAQHRKRKAGIAAGRNAKRLRDIATVEAVLTGDDKLGAVLSDEQLDIVAPELLESAEIIFQPHPGPQTSFFEAAEREVFYGGAAGGGKSMALIVDAARDCSHPGHRAIIFRRFIDELRDLIAKAKEIYPQLYPGCKWNKQESTFTFPSGATIWYTYLETEDDVTRYQGQAFNYIGFDELTQWPTPYCWDYMRSRLRTTAEGLNLYMRATGNPGGLGGHWVKKMFIDPAPWGTAFYATDIESDKVLTWPLKNIDGTPHRNAGLPLFKRRFIPARLSDNPTLFLNGEYEKNLLSLPEVQRKRLLDGDWDVVEGAAFPEFNRLVHVVPPFFIPDSWIKFRAADYGYSNFAAVLWFVSDPDGRLYCYRELYKKGLTVDKFAEAVKELEKNDRIRYGVLDSSVWQKRGEIGPTAAEIMNKPPYNLRWRPSDRSDGSRKAGKLELHRRLAATDPICWKDEKGNDTIIPGKPLIQIFSNCVHLIRTLPALPLDKDDLEDVDTDAEDHAYDALRYGIMSRPLIPRFDFMSRSQGRVSPLRPLAADKAFGY